MTQAEFDRLAALGFTRIPLVAETRADLYTPLAVYVQLAGGPYSYLLESVVGRLLTERGLMVSVAESCTGGLLGHRLTGIPGSSRYFERGVIVYSNEAKEQLLGVPEPLLRAHGAVSAPVAEAMAAGICRIAGSACGLAVTGVAGPDGGSPAKPVGTVFIGCAAPAASGAVPTVEVRHFRFAGGRDAVKWQSAQAALDLLRRALGRWSAAPS